MFALLPPSHDARLLTNGSKKRRLPTCGDSLVLLHEILHAALVCSLSFGSALLTSAGCGGHVRLHDVVLSFLVIGLGTGLQYANSLGAAGSLLMLPKAGKVARGSEQLSFTAFVRRSSCYGVISFTSVLVYALLVSTVAFVLLLELNSAKDYGAIGFAAFTPFRANFDPEAYIDGQNATAAAVVFVLTMCSILIALLNLLTALMIYTWTPQQGERAVLRVWCGAQLLNKCDARMSSKASARAGRREGGRVSGGWVSDVVRNRREDWFAKWQHRISEAPTDEGADRTAAALQLQVTVQGRTRMIDAYPTTTAEQLEHMVVERVGIDGFGLYYRGRPLRGSTALSNYGLTSGATIELKERGRGGGCSQSKCSTVGIEELIPAEAEAGRTSHITPAAIEAADSVATELPTPHAVAVEPASYRERHDARARELGVSEDALRSIGAPRVRAREGAALRVLQWNVLAEGLSDDGFLVRDVLDGAADGVSDQAAAERAKRNHAAVVDWTRRWARMLEFIAASQPDVIALEELDHMADAQEELRALGYECAVHGKQYRPVHEWADASARDAARYVQHLRDVGVALAPKTRSNCRKLGLRTREDADDDGVALFWRSDEFDLLSDGLAFAVIAAHLSSGVENEAARLEELTRLLEWYDSGTPTVWCADTNSAPDHEGERTVWKALRRVASSVWDDFFDKEGRALKQPSPVTTNKMRGPLSAQKKKIGEHTYGAVDDIFISAGVSLRQHAWGPLTYESQEEARTHLLPSLDIPSDHAPVLVDLHLLHDGWHSRLALPRVIQGKLSPYNFESLWAEKRSSHLQGTREWAFEEIEQWRKDESASKLFWLMGGGGVGKSVLSAELLARWLDKRCVAAWHFCRHDDTDQSKPANLLRSIAAMLCHTLDGFEEALSEATGLEDALVSADPSVVFDALIHKPLEKVPSQTAARVIMVDALDEIPKEGQKPLLDVIVNQLASLPTWLRVFVTSREEPLIQKALSAFRPKELRADDAKNRADVEVFLRTIAREHVKGQANMSDVAKAVERQFKIKLPSEALSSLQEKMDESRAIYDLAVRKLNSDPKLRELEQVNEMREPKPKQQSSEFDTIYSWAERAQKVLEESVASEWEEDHALKWLKHPRSEAKKIWVSKADSPGVKGKARAAEKCQNDYDGDAAHLKDVARLTLLFDSCQQMIDGLDALRNKCGFKVVALKNKFAHPTPMGYRDLNLCVEVPIDKETRFVCEIQINHSEMIEAKAKAHKPYEHIRSELPKLCKGTGVDADKLEAFIVGQLNSSALDVAVSALSAKAQGLFLYAFMLQQYLDSEAKANRTIHFDNLDTLPAGLDDVYAVNFRRAFPTDAPERWVTAKPLLELVAATMEPINVAMAASLLRWTADEQERVLELTALLFPVRDGLIHVFHKTVVDWITGDVSEGSSIKTGASEFRVQRDEGHRRFAEGFTRWLQGDANEHYWLKHGIVHLCRAGRADDAVRVYSSDLSFLRRRLDAGLLGTFSTDYLELRRYSPVDLKHATQMKSFVGRHRDVFEREGGGAVTQLAYQQPDESVVFRALGHQEQYLKWRNKPQTFDACIATLLLSSFVAGVAVSKTRIVGGAGQSVYVYDAATKELLETLECGEEVCSVAIYEEQEAGSLLAGLRDGAIKVWDSAILELQSQKSKAHSREIISVAFSPDGKTIINNKPYLIKAYDDAPACIELYLAWCSSQGVTARHMHTDNGTTLCSTAVRALLAARGARLPRSFWWYAMRHAATVAGMLVHAPLRKLPLRSGLWRLVR
ncbi:hypothetical protein AB1Y20_001766 [Prymnesium parvum]|uniref:Ubiquitin-like domain-containing protein n=1 Tax=Prymnesium parvum TaxID=97485 RepID=A0AB34KBS6_PRYPA